MYPVYPYESYEKQCKNIPITFPAQHQEKQPGVEYVMSPLPIFDDPDRKGSGKLEGKIAVITGGDSGIGRAVAVAYAREGADVVINYTAREEKDAADTTRYIKQMGRVCVPVAGDIRDPDVAKTIVDTALNRFGKINILVNNCGVQFMQDSLLDISVEQMIQTFEVNVFSFFVMTKEVLPQLEQGDCIINTASGSAFSGDRAAIDYAASQGAVVSFTRSLGLSLAESGIRVNAVAPGDVWTPLIPSGLSAEQVQTFGNNNPMCRAGQPFEVAPAYVYLASDDSRYVTGQTIHVNGGKFVTT